MQNQTLSSNCTNKHVFTTRVGKLELCRLMVNIRKGELQQYGSQRSSIKRDGSHHMQTEIQQDHHSGTTFHRPTTDWLIANALEPPYGHPTPIHNDIKIFLPVITNVSGQLFTQKTTTNNSPVAYILKKTLLKSELGTFLGAKI